ncbi:MAG: DUF1801 domain-containing protein [Bacteroidia bacterium]|nr:DUF1801 domain-containing protein [Bacteroidia bacterium]
MKTPKFKNLDEFLDYLPDDEKEVTLFLRQLILENVPNVREKLSYNVPYFYLNKSVCFLWPGSVLWGSKRQYNGVRFGFTHGHLLPKELDYFKIENRKYVVYRDFLTVKEIDIDLLKLYLFEAIEIDAQGSKRTSRSG